MTLALHGATAAIHDHVAAAPGDYDRVIALLRASDAADVVSGVTRANVRNLAALARWLVEPGVREKVRSWTLRWPGPGRPGLSPSRLGMVAPRVLHAANLARQAGLNAQTSGLPACVLGPHAEFAGVAPPQPDGKTYGEACDGCRARTSCPGVPPAYLDAFAADLELRAIRA